MTAEIARRLGKVYKEKINRKRDHLDFVETFVATILSQNTSDVNSHRAYQNLRSIYPTWEEVAELSEEELAEAIKIGGLAAQKSKTILQALQAFQERYGGFELEEFATIPDDELLEELTSIKGIGLKTASCTMMFALDRDLCAVDTHIHRVVNRLGIVSAGSPDKSFKELRPLIPKGKAKAFHISLIHFGRDICKAQRPHCYECPLFDLCQWEEKGRYAEERKPGPKAVSGDFIIVDGLKPVSSSGKQK